MGNKKYVHMTLFVVAILAPILSFGLCSIVGESDIFEMAGIARYMWIMWCFLPIPILLLLDGIRLKKRYFKVVAIIVMVIMTIFGSYSFLLRGFFDYDKEIVASASKIMQIYMPEDVKVATDKSREFKISYVKILDETEEESFAASLDSGTKWVDKLSSNLTNALPFDIQAVTQSFDSFIMYNVTLQEYNSYPQANGNFDCIFAAYDKSKSRIILLTDFSLEVS